MHTEASPKDTVCQAYQGRDSRHDSRPRTICGYRRTAVCGEQTGVRGSAPSNDFTESSHATFAQLSDRLPGASPLHTSKLRSTRKTLVPRAPEESPLYQVMQWSRSSKDHSALQPADQVWGELHAVSSKARIRTKLKDVLMDDLRKKPNH